LPLHLARTLHCSILLLCGCRSSNTSLPLGRCALRTWYARVAKRRGAHRTRSAKTGTDMSCRHALVPMVLPALAAPVLFVRSLPLTCFPRQHLLPRLPSRHGRSWLVTERRTNVGGNNASPAGRVSMGRRHYPIRRAARDIFASSTLTKPASVAHIISTIAGGRHSYRFYIS